MIIFFYHLQMCIFYFSILDRCTVRSVITIANISQNSTTRYSGDISTKTHPPLSQTQSQTPAGTQTGLPAIPRTCSEFQTSGADCGRPRPRTRRADWREPSRTPQIEGGTWERCSGTELPPPRS